MIRFRSVVPGIEHEEMRPIGTGRFQVVVNNVLLEQVRVAPGTEIYLGGITTPKKPIVVKGGAGTFCPLDLIVRRVLEANLEFFTQEAVLRSKIPRL